MIMMIIIQFPVPCSFHLHHIISNKTSTLSFHIKMAWNYAFLPEKHRKPVELVQPSRIIIQRSRHQIHFSSAIMCERDQISHHKIGNGYYRYPHGGSFSSIRKNSFFSPACGIIFLYSGYAHPRRQKNCLSLSPVIISFFLFLVIIISPRKNVQ